jgi:hypothetical protein
MDRTKLAVLFAALLAAGCAYYVDFQTVSAALNPAAGTFNASQQQHVPGAAAAAAGSCHLQQQGLRHIAEEVWNQLNGQYPSSYAAFTTVRAWLRAELSAHLKPLAKHNCSVVGLSALSAARDHQQDSQSSPSTVAPGSGKTAMVLVSNSWEKAEMYLQNYSLNVLTHWNYANSWGYGLELYVHDSPLPPQVSGHFAKIWGIKRMFDLGYDYVLGLDWDMYIHPGSSVPLSSFFDEWPSASVMLQGESNLNTGALLYRNTPQARKWLDHWWHMGVSGCCQIHTFDQIAFKHMLQSYMRNVTGNNALYSNKTQQLFRQLATGNMPSLELPPVEQRVRGVNHEPHFLLEPPQTDVGVWLELKQGLQASGSEFGFVGLGVHDSGANAANATSSRVPVALHSCHGIWWGCVPSNSSALLMHTSHRRTPDTDGFAWLAEKIVNALSAWRQATKQAGRSQAANAVHAVLESCKNGL